MRRSIFLSSLYIALAWLICSCQPAPSISVSQSSLSFTSAGGREVVTVNANYEWTAKASASWIRLQTSKDSNDLTITVSANSETDPRQGTVTLTCQEATTTISVSQAQLDVINIKDAALIKTDESARDIEIKLESNVDVSVTVASGKEWIQIKSTKAMTAHTVTLAIAANTTRQTRLGTVSFSDSSGKIRHEVSIQQQGLPHVLEFTVTGVSTYTVPQIIGLSDGTFFSGYLWIGDQQLTYTSGYQLSLDPDKSTKVKIEGYNVGSVGFSNIKGLTKVDLSNL